MFLFGDLDELWGWVLLACGLQDLCLDFRHHGAIQYSLLSRHSLEVKGLFGERKDIAADLIVFFSDGREHQAQPVATLSLCRWVQKS